MTLEDTLLGDRGKLNHIKFSQNASLMTRPRDLKFKHAHKSLNSNSFFHSDWKYRSQVVLMEVLVCLMPPGTLIQEVPDISLRNTGGR